MTQITLSLLVAGGKGNRAYSCWRKTNSVSEGDMLSVIASQTVRDFVQAEESKLLSSSETVLNRCLEFFEEVSK